MNRATLNAVNFTVSFSHERANPVGKDGDDGDLHASGIAKTVGLPMVVEVVNAAQQDAAVNILRTKAGTSTHARIAGVWRLWFEHPSKAQQKQFDPIPDPEDTNPKHVFEIHPVTMVDTKSTLSSFVPIPKFEAYDAVTAFEYYDKLKATIQASKTVITITSPKAQYNYAEFKIELLGNPMAVEDGFLVLTKVLTMEGNQASEKPRRMIFVKDTPAAAELAGKKKGERLRVLGIPRINLAEVAVLVQQNGLEQFTTNLPYEMIIVGVK
ncbi:MAG: hypothetical protein M1451_11850 [Acidobacteria bacterium]|nr:hypothetical protein [Acidobacteriota bacterium]